MKKLSIIKYSSMKSQDGKETTISRGYESTTKEEAQSWKPARDKAHTTYLNTMIEMNKIANNNLTHVHMRKFCFFINNNRIIYIKIRYFVMNINLKSIINQLRSNDQTDIYNGYDQLINYVKFNIVESKSIIDIFEFIIPHLMDQEISDELHSKVLEVSNFMIDFFAEEHQEIIAVLLDTISQYGFIGNENNDIVEKVENLISTILKCGGLAAVDMLALLFSQWICDDSWRCRQHIVSLMTMAITSSLLDVSSLIAKYPDLIENVLSLLGNDMDDEELNQLVSIMHNEAKDSLERFILSTLKDKQLKSQLISKLEIHHPIVSTPTETTVRATKPTSSIFSSSIKQKPTLSSSTIKSNNNLSKSTTTRAIGSRPTKNNDPFGMLLLNQELDEEQLESKLKEIIDKLSDSSSDWSIKVNNLIKLQVLMRAGAADLPIFHSLFTKLRDPLISLVKDVRSQLIKEACATIAVVAEFMKSQFEPYVDRYIELLLTNVIVTIQIISQSSDNCIKSIITASKSIKALPRFAEMLKHSKSPVMRSKCHEYILLLLQIVSPAILEKQEDALERSIRAGVSDADPNTRKLARQSFLAYSAHFPHKTEQLLQSFDLSAKKLIIKEMQSFNPTYELLASSSSSNNNNNNNVPKQQQHFTKNNNNNNTNNHQVLFNSTKNPITQTTKITTTTTPTTTTSHQIRPLTTVLKPTLSKSTTSLAIANRPATPLNNVSSNVGLLKRKPITSLSSTTLSLSSSTTAKTTATTTTTAMIKPTSTLLQKRGFNNIDDDMIKSNLKHIKLDKENQHHNILHSRPPTPIVPLTTSIKLHSVKKPPTIPTSKTSQQFVSFFNNNSNNNSINIKNNNNNNYELKSSVSSVPTTTVNQQQLTISQLLGQNNINNNNNVNIRYNKANQQTTKTTLTSIMSTPPPASQQNRPNNYFQNSSKKAAMPNRTLMPLSSSINSELKISDLGL
ncbi:CLIP-associating protein [Heterostelium album PN500]|uniref:CLIP-associating protein n=1 Tax=Heterostelium pallidum (strain ATCC 26659 / Pp 5 / PN500) TaxID=670386 RepID=D3BHU5_HETP5|nr:CLIP-associating protein [Heterostelium album PN500]EFA78845.1 CLIP-associating protein [Heterostelium album PN500]|eukprot:XP_020430969.1 CLIP-associating protein [Heterostelium album PN500]